MARFLKDFSSKFKKFEYSKPNFINNCNNKNKLEFTPSQKLYKEIIKPELEESNEKGLLIYAGTGFGKTLSSLIISKNYIDNGYNIILVTRTSLKENFYKDLEKIGINKKDINTCSYKQFSNLYFKKGTLYKTLYSKNKNKDNILDNCLVIIDECHKIFGKNLKLQEMHNINNFVKLLKNGYSTKKFKLILMTATPIEKEPMECIKLLNLLSKEDLFPEQENSFRKEYLDNNGFFTKKGLKLFSEKIQGLVSFIDTTKDITRFPQVDISYISVNTPVHVIKSIKKDCKINLI